MIPAAQGRVLEVGIGSGLNLPFYGPDASEVVGLDPSAPLRMAGHRIGRIGQVVKMVEGTAEAIPIDDATFETVLTTWTLWSIPDLHAALSEIRRVLKGSGALVFV